jgi:hypothetical protein
MSFLDQYTCRLQGGLLSVSAEQGSQFAKQIASDFNPIHDVDSKRFCVPGDLLFSLALQKYGLHQQMNFHFMDLVNAETPLQYPELNGAVGSLTVSNQSGKSVLAVDYAGDCSSDNSQIEQVIKNYVAFSGQNFPHILVPLMQQHRVMINPNRPLVIYQSMALNFESLEFEKLQISLAETQLEIDGKRGNATLNFSMKNQGEVIGSGHKCLVLSGLREYQDSAIENMCDDYMGRRDRFLRASSVSG